LKRKKRGEGEEKKNKHTISIIVCTRCLVTKELNKEKFFNGVYHYIQMFTEYDLSDIIDRNREFSVQI
jgi:hypothetical protein